MLFVKSSSKLVADIYGIKYTKEVSHTKAWFLHNHLNYSNSPLSDCPEYICCFPTPNFVLIDFSWDDYNFENRKHVCKIWGGGINKVYSVDNSKVHVRSS